MSAVIAALFFELGWQVRQHSHKQDASSTPPGALTMPHAIGSEVDIPNGFDNHWGSMKHSGLGKVSILKVAVSPTPKSILVASGPKSYEVDVLTRVCANGSGFAAAPGSDSADIADAVSSHLFLVPEVQRGINGFYFGAIELSATGTPPTLIHVKLLTLAPTMKPNQCFVGVATYAVPTEIGSPANLTRYAVVLASNSFTSFTSRNFKTIWWSPTSPT
ncbi:MAG: hypothetical protein ACYC1I_09200 [Acidimicrobiales bacterium]